MPRRRKRNILHNLLNDIFDTTYTTNNYVLTKNIFLSFDVATKTLAYCIVKVPKDLTDELQYINKQVSQLSEITDQKMRWYRTYAMTKRLRNFITVIDGSVDNLIPDKKDADISEVERIKAFVNHFKNNLQPKLTELGLGPDNTTILIEHQMSPNFKARAISNAIVAMFYEYDTHIVKPILKNRINLTKDGHWVNFVKQYSTLYAANKKHAIYNFELLCNEINVPKSLIFSKTQISHVSDAFMQVLGFLRFNLK